MICSAKRTTQPVVRAVDVGRSVPAILLLTAWLLISGTTTAQEQYPVRMKIELLSIRNRSVSPIPVQIKLEYNQPQILQGTLELSLHDALDVVSQEGLLATMRLEDIVLSGGDYIFNTVLPPLQTSGTQNLAVIGWFQTKTERIPLSSSLKELDPPKPHDLLMVSPGERATLICSCSGSSVFQNQSANQIFLDRALSLENYNPLAEPEGGETGPGDRRNERSFGQNIQYYSVHWSSRDLPEDPLSYCCFDLVLLVDGALARLSGEQMTALNTWVRAGGSLVIVPDAPMRPLHLQLIRDLFEESEGSFTAAGFSLDDEGLLLKIGDDPDQVLLASPGLGRAALLPRRDQLSTILTGQTLGRLVAHLWNVKKDSPVWQGLAWQNQDIIRHLQELGIAAGRDSRGVYIEQGVRIGGANQVGGRRVYYSEESLRTTYQLDEGLAPVRDPLVAKANEALMPEDVEMVPTWVIGLILTAYVLTIGPVDYLVLGFLRIRKATWIVFPVVTALFTILTIWVAHLYMGTTETGGYLEITDIVGDGEAIRRTRMDMLFYGSRTVHQTEHRKQLIVPVADAMFAVGRPGFDYDPFAQRLTTTAVLNYSGHFPSSYKVSQTVQQWSPQLTRTFELAPENAELPPGIDWSDPLLATTEAGRRKLTEQLRQLETAQSGSWGAAVLHRDRIIPVHHQEMFSDPTAQLDPQLRMNQYQFRQFTEGFKEQLPLLIARATANPDRRDLFRLVSRIAPKGSGLLEDLPMLDPADEQQWALIVIHRDGSSYRAFRRLFVVAGQKDPGAERSEQAVPTPTTADPDPVNE